VRKRLNRERGVLETTKTCRSCQENKSISLFGRDKARKDGLNPVCKECRIKEGRAYRTANKEAISRRWKTRYNLDPSKKREADERYRIKDGGANRRSRDQHRYRTDPVYRLSRLITSKLRDVLSGRRKFAGKSIVASIVGLTGERLINYLWGTFELNYGIPRGWVKRSDVEIDHITPKCMAKTVEGVKKLNHYTNLQLLLKEDNKLKRDRIPQESVNEAEVKGEDNERA